MAFLVCSADLIEDIDPNLSQFTVGRKNIKFM